MNPYVLRPVKNKTALRTMPGSEGCFGSCAAFSFDSTRKKKAGAGDVQSPAPQTQNAACLLCQMIERSGFQVCGRHIRIQRYGGRASCLAGDAVGNGKTAKRGQQHNFRYVVLCLLRRAPQSSLYYIACQNSNTLFQINPFMSAFIHRFQTGRGNFAAGLCVYPFYLLVKRQAASK